jgi:hypothetical protein
MRWRNNGIQLNGGESIEDTEKDQTGAIKGALRSFWKMPRLRLSVVEDGSAPPPPPEWWWWADEDACPAADDLALDGVAAEASVELGFCVEDLDLDAAAGAVGVAEGWPLGFCILRRPRNGGELGEQWGAPRGRRPHPLPGGA